MSLLDDLYAIALYAYPAEFRARFGREMRQVFRARREACPNHLKFLLASARDLAVSAIKERLTMQIFIPRYASFGALFLLGMGLTSLHAFVIPTSSMEPSLRPGDHLLVNRLARDPQRGDIIAFFPYPEDRSETFVKRVIGVPGDRIHIVNKEVIRNGERLNEPYAQHLDDYVDTFRDNFPARTNVHLEPNALAMLAKNVVNGEVVVPEGAYFVLGDNRDRSLDSRFIGFVPKTSVVGQPWRIYWSYDAIASQTRWDRTLLRVR